MEARDLLRVLAVLREAGCACWLDGGWGIDALLGHQTRPHGDADLAIDARDATVISCLTAMGYVETTDERPTRIELRHPDGQCVDLHPLHWQPNGDALQYGAHQQVWRFRAEWFSTGSIAGRRVPCFTAEAQRYFHTRVRAEGRRPG